MDVVREGGGAHDAIGTVRVAPQRDWAAGAGRDGIHDGSDVLELPLDRVVRGVTARATTSAIDGERGHGVAQLAHQHAVAGVVTQRTVYQYERRPTAVDPHCDGRPIDRMHVETGRSVSGSPLAVHGFSATSWM